LKEKKKWAKTISKFGRTCKQKGRAKGGKKIDLRKKSTRGGKEKTREMEGYFGACTSFKITKEGVRHEKKRSAKSTVERFVTKMGREAKVKKRSKLKNNWDCDGQNERKGEIRKTGRGRKRAQSERRGKREGGSLKRDPPKEVGKREHRKNGDSKSRGERKRRWGKAKR